MCRNCRIGFVRRLIGPDGSKSSRESDRFRHGAALLRHQRVVAGIARAHFSDDAGDRHHLPADDRRLVLPGGGGGRFVQSQSRRLVAEHVPSHGVGVRGAAPSNLDAPQGRQLLHQSDLGCQYTSDAYQQTLRRLGIECSMTRTGCCYDNAAMDAPSVRFQLVVARTRRQGAVVNWSSVLVPSPPQSRAGEGTRTDDHQWHSLKDADSVRVPIAQEATWKTVLIAEIARAIEVLMRGCCVVRANGVSGRRHSRRL